MEFRRKKKKDPIAEAPLLGGTLESARDFFEHSPIWRDIEREFNIWLNEIHAQLENDRLEFDHRQLDRLGGNAETLRNVLNFPEVYLEALEDQARRK